MWWAYDLKSVRIIVFGSFYQCLNLYTKLIREKYDVTLKVTKLRVEGVQALISREVAIVTHYLKM